MLAYTLRRVLISIPLLLCVLFASFSLLYALPGDPVDAMLGRMRTEEAAQRIREQEGLNDPIPVQFGRYLQDVIQGDFGRNQKKISVAGELKVRLPATIELAVAAIVIASIFGLLMGVTSALRPRSLHDLIALGVSLAGVSMPIFWLGLLMQRLLRRGGVLDEVSGFGGLPLGGRLSEQSLVRIDQLALQSEVIDSEPLRRTGFHLIDSIFVFWDTSIFLDALYHLFLPALVLATVPMAIITRITRAAVLEQMSQNYVRTALAKGLGMAGAVRHALGNAAIPIVTAIGTQLGYLLGGAVLTETIFNWPGLGTYIVEAILKEDVRPLQAGVLVIAGGFIVINLLIDLSYALLDPRVRLDGAPS